MRLFIREHEEREWEIKASIRELQDKLAEKNAKLDEKEAELSRLTDSLQKAHSVLFPFRNHKANFTAPQITGKVPVFGADKWVEQQNKAIAKEFNSAINKLESLYQEEAERQIQTVQKNMLVDYGELRSLRKEVETLTDGNNRYISTINAMFEQLATPSIRIQLVEILDAMSGGTPVNISMGGGGDYPSDFRWDGRNPDEEEEDYRRRCVIKAFSVMQDHLNQQKKGRRRGR